MSHQKCGMIHFVTTSLVSTSVARTVSTEGSVKSGSNAGEPLLKEFVLIPMINASCYHTSGLPASPWRVRFLSSVETDAGSSLAMSDERILDGYPAAVGNAGWTAVEGKHGCAVNSICSIRKSLYSKYRAASFHLWCELEIIFKQMWKNKAWEELCHLLIEGFQDKEKDVKK